VSGDHYFSPAPAGEDQRRPLRAHLAGRTLALETTGGVFSPDRVDAGTSVLLGAVPDPPATGHLLDLGCGWGPVALSLAIRAPGAAVWAVDVNERALALTAANAERSGLANVRAALPGQVPDDVELAAIWSNPPIRVGKAALHAMLLHWLPRLAPGAAAHLVVQKNLGSDSLQRWLTDEGLPSVALDADVERATSERGFRVLRVTRASRATA
jgi:16S rRNA (guanine1207-N2)-methyltransferase